MQEDEPENILSGQVLLAQPCAKGKGSCHANLYNVVTKAYLIATLQVPCRRYNLLLEDPIIIVELTIDIDLGEAF
ncbi:MAG: hypothetical protein LH478_12325 [Chitinophagaceae bacterium]|nr:hypothetical protein [Chitinophagaceae bacterium]